MKPVWIQPVRFSEETREKLCKLLGDTVADAFLHRAAGALEAFIAMRHLDAPEAPNNELGDMPPLPRGRPPDGDGIVFIGQLAAAFRAAGGRVSSGDRSRFVRAVEAVSNDKLCISDIRQKVRAALSAISDSI